MRRRRGKLEYEPVSFGSIDALRLSNGLLTGSPMSELNELFRDDLLPNAKARLDELGIPHLLDWNILRLRQPYEAHLAVLDALNVNRADAHDFDPAENEAWFLIAFIYFYHMARLSDEANDAPITDRSLSAIIDLGRLLEWWRWRREGHDLNAFKHADQRRKSSDSSTEQWKTFREQNEPIYREISERLRRGGMIGTITRQMVKDGRYNGKPNSLARNYRRWSRGH